MKPEKFSFKNKSFRLIAVLFLCLINVLNVYYLRPALSELHDFGSFMAAGRAAESGLNPYSSDLPLVYVVRSDNSEKTISSPNLNPPISVLFFRLIAKANPYTAVQAWRIISFLIYCITIFILARHYQTNNSPLVLVWVFSLAGIWNIILLGQIYTPLILLATLTWIFLEKEDTRLGGIALGTLIAIKPNFLFWLMLLFISRQYSLFKIAILTSLLISVLPLPFFGITIYKQWLSAVSIYPSIGLYIAGNSSLQSLGTRLGSQLLGWSMVIIVVGCCFIFVLKRQYDRLATNSLGIIGSLVIFPFSWVGYTVMTLPIFYSTNNWNWHNTLAASLLAFPYLLVLRFFNLSQVHSAIFGWIYGWALLTLLITTFTSRLPNTSNAI